MSSCEPSGDLNTQASSTKEEESTEPPDYFPPQAESTSVGSNLQEDSAFIRSAFRRDSAKQNMSDEMVDIPAKTKKVKIIEPKSVISTIGGLVDNDSEEDESQNTATANALTPAANVSLSNAAIAQTIQAATVVEPTDAAAAIAKKNKEDRKKEREKRKEEDMIKKYQAEQEAKQKAAAKSKCGRWIKHNIKIGEGGYKFVYRGYDCTEARNVAWCEFKPEHVDTKEKRQAMYRETEIMLKMTHPHIVRCFDVFREWTNEEIADNPLEEKGIVIIQELMGEGTLKSVIKKNFLEGQCILKFPLITRWWHQILDALMYMHHKLESPILHRDLKADNCFLYGASDEEYLNVKVGDFGLATHVGNSGRKTMLGTLGFMAPEIFDEKYDEKVDIYAFGMLMLEVMTNRTPYDECDTMIQVAAKTMSGHGPDLMQKISNPTLSNVIGACIHPLACFRPTAEELYFHPLFQRYQDGDETWPKTLPVEVEPNSDKASDRVEVIERFVRSLAVPETRNPKFNLRLRFRDKKMLQELGLDDGESLEFYLDIYKAEDQDIPELIHNLRIGYEDKLWRVFEKPKQPDKIVSNNLDKLFSSIRLQMQFLVKCLLGRRWKDLLNSLTSDNSSGSQRRIPRDSVVTGSGVSGGVISVAAAETEDESDYDDGDCSNFAIIGQCKSKWNKAKKLLDREIQAYRNMATKTDAVAASLASTVVSPSLSAATVPQAAAAPTTNVNAQISVPTQLPPSSSQTGGVQVIPPISSSASSGPTEVICNASPSKTITLTTTTVTTTSSAQQLPPPLTSHQPVITAASVITGQPPVTIKPIYQLPQVSSEVFVSPVGCETAGGTCIQGDIASQINTASIEMAIRSALIQQLLQHSYSTLNQAQFIQTQEPNTGQLPVGSHYPNQQVSASSMCPHEVSWRYPSNMLLRQAVPQPLSQLPDNNLVSSANQSPLQPLIQSTPMGHILAPSQPNLSNFLFQENQMLSSNHMGMPLQPSNPKNATLDQTFPSLSHSSVYHPPGQGHTFTVSAVDVHQQQQQMQSDAMMAHTLALQQQQQQQQIKQQQQQMQNLQSNQIPLTHTQLQEEIPLERDISSDSELCHQPSSILPDSLLVVSSTIPSGFQNTNEILTPQVANYATFHTNSAATHPMASFASSSALMTKQSPGGCFDLGTAWNSSNSQVYSPNESLFAGEQQQRSAVHRTSLSQESNIASAWLVRKTAEISGSLRSHHQFHNNRGKFVTGGKSGGREQWLHPRVVVTSPHLMLHSAYPSMSHYPASWHAGCRPLPVDRKPKRKISTQSKPRYIIRITKLERDSEGSEPGNLRPTFYLEMPDMNNPNSELWKLSFRCNISDTMDDVKLFEGQGYTQMNKEINQAVKETVAVMLKILRENETAIKLNYDYAFYPRISAELIENSTGLMPTATEDPSKSNNVLGDSSLFLEAGAIGSSQFIASPPGPLRQQPPTTMIECATDFDDENLSDTSLSTDSPIDRIDGMKPPLLLQQPPLGGHFPIQLQQPDASMSYHTVLEEVSPLITNNVYQIINSPHDPQLQQQQQFFLAKTPIFTTEAPFDAFDSTESLPTYANTTYSHHHPLFPSKEADVFIALKVPAYEQSLIAQVANHLNSKMRKNPILVFPGDVNSPGNLMLMPENQSFLCSQRGSENTGRGSSREVSVLPFPQAHCLLVVQDESSLGSQTRVFRPPDVGALLITPDEEVHYIQRPTLVIPGEKTSSNVAGSTGNPNLRSSTTGHHNGIGQTRLVEVPISSSDGQLTFDDLLALMVTLRGLPLAPIASSSSIVENRAIPTNGGPLSQTVSEKVSMCEPNMVATSLAQDANYFSLPYGAVPLYSTGVPGPSFMPMGDPSKPAAVRRPPPTPQPRPAVVPQTQPVQVALNQNSINHVANVILRQYQNLMPGMLAAAQQQTQRPFLQQMMRNSLPTSSSQGDLGLTPSSSTTAFKCDENNSPGYASVPPQPLSNQHAFQQPTTVAPPVFQINPQARHTIPQPSHPLLAQSPAWHPMLQQQSQTPSLSMQHILATAAQSILQQQPPLTSTVTTNSQQVEQPPLMHPLASAPISVAQANQELLAFLLSNPAFLSNLPSSLWTNSPTTSVQSTSVGMQSCPLDPLSGTVVTTMQQPPIKSHSISHLCSPQEYNQLLLQSTLECLQQQLPNYIQQPQVGLPPVGAMPTSSRTIPEIHSVPSAKFLVTPVVPSQIATSVPMTTDATNSTTPIESTKPLQLNTGLPVIAPVSRQPVVVPPLVDTRTSQKPTAKFLVTPVVNVVSTPSSAESDCMDVPTICNKFTVAPVDTLSQDSRLTLPTARPTVSSEQVSSKMIPSKFTVATVVTDALKAPIVSSIHSSESDTPNDCPPPPSTPAISNQASSCELPPSSSN